MFFRGVNYLKSPKFFKVADTVKDVTIRINVEDKSVKDSKKTFDALNKEIAEQEGLIGKLTKKQELLAKQRKKSNDPAEIKKFNRELQKTEKELNKLTSAGKKQEKQMGGLEKGLLKVGGAMVAAFAVSAIIDFGVELRKLSIQLEADARKNAVVFGDELERVTKRAKENANAIGLTTNEYLRAAAATQDLLVPLGLTRSAAADMSVQLTDLSGSLSVWSGGQRSSSEVSEILTKALLGETEQLKTLGILVDQSSKDFNDRIKVIMETEGVTQQQAKATDILNQVMEKSADAQASAAEGSMTLAQQTAQTTAELNEQKETLATTMIPVWNLLDQALGQVIEQLDKTVEGLTELFEFNFDDLGGAANSLGKIYTGLDFNLDKLTQTIARVDEGFGKLTLEQLKSDEVQKQLAKTYTALGLSVDEAGAKYKAFIKAQIQANKIAAKSEEETDAQREARLKAEKAAYAKRLEALKKASAQRTAERKKEIADEKEARELDEENEDEFLASIGLTDEQLEKIEEQRLKRDEAEKAAEMEMFDFRIKNQEAALNFETEMVEAKKQLDQSNLDSTLNLVSGILAATGASAQQQVALLVLMKAVEIARVVSTTAATNAVITAEGLALAIPSAGASVAAAAGYVTANNIQAGLNIAAIVATAIPQVAAAVNPKKLKDGEVLIDGAGTETSDSIPALLSRNESVINAKSSKKHTAALKAINEDRFDDYLNRVVMKKLYDKGVSSKKEISIPSGPQDINFPERMAIKNAAAISKPIVDAIEDSNFLKSAGWD